MMKSLGLLPRKIGSARSAFRDYYENNHAPLALGLFPFQKYVRNHLPPDSDDDIGFDTISEFWTADVASIIKLMEGEVGATMKADELKFMNQPTVRSGGAEEFLLRGTPRGIDHGLHKVALLLKKQNGADVTALKAWGAGLPAERVSLDLVSPWSEGWPCDAIVWVWSETTISTPPKGFALWRKLRLAAFETSPDTRP
jgi:uncharacterized protein (TIGR02118 family)